MPDGMWERLDNAHATHRKMRAAGLFGRALWHASLGQCCQLTTDGRVDPQLLTDSAYYADLHIHGCTTEDAAAALVACGLWHDSRTVRKCDHCAEFYGKVPAGTFVFHDYWEYQPTKQQIGLPVEFLREKRRQALKGDRRLCQAVVARDGYQCRYCGCEVNVQDKRGPNGLTYDHVDPFLGLRDPDYGNRLSNVVVCCRRENGIKRDRTPEQAGMVLRPAPNQKTSGSQPDANRTTSGSDLAPRARVTRDGTGRVASSSDLVPRQVPLNGSNGSGVNGNRGKQ